MKMVGKSPNKPLAFSLDSNDTYGHDLSEVHVPLPWRDLRLGEVKVPAALQDLPQERCWFLDNRGC